VALALTGWRWHYRAEEGRSMRNGILVVTLCISLGIAGSSSAMVTVFSTNRMRKQTVFTDAGGRYLIVVDYEGDLTVRARASNFADLRRTLEARDRQSDCHRL
jgi:predicted lipoprotein with Yx(FWY)xxD motif